MKKKENYTTGEVSQLLNIPRRTISKYCAEGIIKATQHPFTKMWKVAHDDIYEFMRANGLDQKLVSSEPSVLIVDDEEIVRRTVRRIMTKEKYTTLEAVDGRKGLELVNYEKIDLILLDLEMPDMNGVEFLSSLHQLEHRIPVIIITGYPDSQLMMEALQFGPVTLISKPIFPQMLLDAVRQVLATAGNVYEGEHSK